MDDSESGNREEDGSWSSKLERIMDNGIFDFAAKGLPVPSRIVSPEEALKESRERSIEVINRWNELSQILDRHEATIRKRWIKKTKTQRATILLEAWPNMSTGHRPDFDAYLNNGPKAHQAKLREAYLWPYINLEDLCKGKTLLIFLDSRGRNAPRMFAHADFEAMNLGIVTKATTPPLVFLHTMYLDSETSESYGRIVHWDDDGDAYRDKTNGRGHPAGAGLMILEIQQRIMGFLVKCCQTILHDINPDVLIAGTEVKPSLPLVIDSAEYLTSGSIAAEAPYRLPALLDFNRLNALISAKRTEVEEHIRALREDPGYFADTIKEWSEHRLEHILDINGNRHPLLNKPSFWNKVIGLTINRAYGALFIWDIISEELSHLASLQKKYSDVITPEKDLPMEYLKELILFRATLNRAKITHISDLKTGLPSSFPFRNLFHRQPCIPGSDDIYLMTKSSPRDVKDEVLWLFSCLWTEDQLLLLRLPTIVDEIEHQMQRDPKEKARLTPWVAREFADLGSIARADHELELYQPWASNFETQAVELNDQTETEFGRRTMQLREMNEHMKKISFGIHDPTDGRFQYPSDRRRTKLTTNAMRQAEHNLDAYWSDIDTQYLKLSGKTLHDAVKHLCRGQFQLERTPEWVEPTTETKAVLQKTSSNDAVSSLALLSIGSTEASPKFVVPEPKVKIKTRGSGQESPVPEQEVPILMPDEQPTFTVKARAHKVFKTLFFNPSQSDLPGEISWTDFLYAMTSTGFTPEKLYGSVWQFTPSVLGEERSIQFHEPHPVGKIPFRNARRMGRRLTRAYGWHGGMFSTG